MLLSKYKREPEAWNKHVVPDYESEATSSSADTAHPFRLIPWLLELDSSGGTSYYRLSGPSWGFSSGSAEKKLPAKQETQKIQVGSLGQEDALEEGMVTHSSILGWRISRIEEAGGLQVHGVTQSDLKWLTMHACKDEEKKPYLKKIY